MKRFRAACVQMRSGRDIDANLRQVGDFVCEAVSLGANYVQTPEVTTLMEKDRERLFAITEHQEDNRSLEYFSTLAAEQRIWLHIGSMGIKLSADKLANRAFLFDPNGKICAFYDKIHMFDVDLGQGERYRESANYAPGNKLVWADLPWGRLGLSICYDIRFPALYQQLTQVGAAIITIPAAFTRATGVAHWHCLQRARAIETSAFVISAAQCGIHDDGRQTFGHSLIVNPNGEILAEADASCGVIAADIEVADDKVQCSDLGEFTNHQDDRELMLPELSRNGTAMA